MKYFREAIKTIKNDNKLDNELSGWSDIRTFEYDNEGSMELGKVVKNVVINRDQSFMFISDKGSDTVEDIIKKYNLKEMEKNHI